MRSFLEAAVRQAWVGYQVGDLSICSAEICRAVLIGTAQIRSSLTWTKQV